MALGIVRVTLISQGNVSGGTIAGTAFDSTEYSDVADIVTALGTLATAIPFTGCTDVATGKALQDRVVPVSSIYEIVAI